MYAEELRKSRIVWFFRLGQIFAAIIVLGLVAQNASIWSPLDCKVPARVAFNLAAAAFTFPVVIYLIFTTGYFSHGLWWAWGQVGIDGFLFALWIAAAATSTPDGDDICSACTALGEQVDSGDGYNLFIGDYFFSCVLTTDLKKREFLGAAKSSSALFKRDDTQTLRVAAVQAMQGFEGILVFLFLVTLVYGIVVKLGYGPRRRQDNSYDAQMAQAGYDAGYGQEMH